MVAAYGECRCCCGSSGPDVELVVGAVAGVRLRVPQCEYLMEVTSRNAAKVTARLLPA